MSPKVVSLDDLESDASAARALSETTSKRVPAVVVGGSVNGLGVTRSLAQAGIPVVLLAERRGTVAESSRSVSCTVVCNDIYYDGLVSNLAKLGQCFETRPVLFLTHDFQVLQVGRQRNLIERTFRFLIPDLAVIENLLFKDRFHRLGGEQGLVVPDTRVFSGFAELDEFLQGADPQGSWVVKPFGKSDAFEACFGKAQIVAGKEAWHGFRARYARVDVPILMQTMVPGPDSNVLFCLVVFDGNRRCVASFCGQKIRQYKPMVGNTASARPFRDEDLERQTRRFLESNDFIGMGSMEFKRGADDGRLYAIEPTLGRTNLQSELAVLNGCNLPAIYHGVCSGSDGCEEDVRSEAAVVGRGRVWMRFAADFESSWHYWRRGELSLADYFRPFRAPISFSVWRWSDPMPAVGSWARRTVAFGKSIAKRILGRRLTGALRSIVAKPAPGRDR